MAPLQISETLAAVIGKGPMPRTQVMKEIWGYIKSHNLQDPNNKRDILPDAPLAAVFGRKTPVNMFEMTKLVNQHLS